MERFLEEHQIVAGREDPYLTRFKEFVDTEWGRPAVENLFRGLFSAGGYPPIPTPHQWDVPQQIDIVELVWQQVQTHSFIEENWAAVRMMMSDNITNTTWAAQVMTVLAFYNVVKILPIAIAGYNEQTTEHLSEAENVT